MSATVIGVHARVLGSILVGDPPGSGPAGAPGAGHGDLVIDGVVEGDVRASGQLTLGRRARVDGEIHARDVRIAGVLHRSVSAAGVIHLLSTAKVRGDLEAARVIIDDGALFEGLVRLHRETSLAQAPKATSPSPIQSRPTPASRATAPQVQARNVPELATPGRRRLQRRVP